LALPLHHLFGTFQAVVNFGREEIDIISPCVGEAKAEGIAADGPFSPDTIFVRAKDGAFDAVLAMYHDRGQIAMKLLGFDRGVTLLGAFHFRSARAPTANVGATRATVRPAIAMANRVRAI
jgi:4-hydroxythreonine-4-phosphate dehydrogenase